MRFARVKCLECNEEFIIKFRNDIPKFKLTCPICKGERCRVVWIDRAKLTENNSKVVDPCL